MQSFNDICPPLYRDTDPGRLPLCRSAYRKIIGWEYGPRGLLVHGPTGSGKTRATWMLIQRLIAEGRFLMWYDCVDFGHAVARYFSDKDLDPQWWIGQLAKAPVLFFDDLGKAKLTDRVESEFFGIIEKRIANCVPTLITTNLNSKALAHMLSPDRGPAMIRRLKEYFEDVSAKKEKSYGPE